VTEIATAEDLRAVIRGREWVLVYFSRPDCSVCTAIRPKVEALVARFSTLEAFSVDLDKMPHLAGGYSVFTIPAILVYVDGAESIREARYVSMDELLQRLERLHAIRFTA
jgi:thioredoxin-like negative regulator of GroEL